MAKPPKKRVVRSLFELLAAQRADVAPRPSFPVGPTSEPPGMRATPPGRVPERGPETFWEGQRRIQAAIPEIAFQIPQAILRDIRDARTPDQIVMALTGLQLEPGKRSPLNAVALAGLLGPGFAQARKLEIAERALLAAERNAANYARRSAPALARLDPMTVPAFERAGGRVRDIGSMLGTGDLAALPQRGGALKAAVQEGFRQGGFTVDRTGKAFAGSGFAVANPKLTRLIDPGDPNALERFLARADVQAALERPGAYVGGWTDPQTGRMEINVTDIIENQSDAVRLARQRKQKAYGEFRNGEYVGDRDYIASPAVVGADGKTYRGVNHGDARDAAAEALRATPEGRAAMAANHGNAVMPGKQRMFELGNGSLVQATDWETANLARKSGQAPNLATGQGLHSSDLLPQGESHAPLPPKFLMTSARGRDLHDALLADEAARITRRNVPAFEAAAQTLPSTRTFGAGAVAGAPKLGWYQNSARALAQSFGPEAPRFAALLSALSPQQPVEKNLAMALDTWEAWTAQGRPQDPAIIRRIMDDVARATPEGKQMGSRVPNSIAALTAVDPASLALSGPKVFSFHRNLIGEAQRVTLDTWMAQLANVNPSSLSRTVRGVGTPSPTYLAYSGRIRQTAEALSRATGRKWTPAEVQETLWSWGKALSETAEPLSRGVHPSQLSLAGIAPSNMRELIPHLPASAIAGAPDFATLLGGEANAASLARQGLPAPSAAEAVSPGNLPPIDLPGLEELAANMDRSRRGFFGNKRGALGGKPRDPSVVGEIEHDPTGEIAASRRMMAMYPAPPPPPGGFPKRPGFMVYTRNSPREWWRLSNIEEDSRRAFRLGDYWTANGQRGEFRVVPVEDMPTGNTSDLYNPVRQIGEGIARPTTPVTPLFPGAKDEELARRILNDPDLGGNRRGAIGGRQTVLRVENAAGHGPYHGEGPMSAMQSNPGVLDEVLDPEVPIIDYTKKGAIDRQPMLTAPEPWSELAPGAELFNDPDIVFGFRNDKQLRRWFTPHELEQMAARGYRVQPYEAQKIIYDRAQAIFNRRLATPLNATPLATFVPKPVDNRIVIPAMLGGSAAASGGALTLYEYLRGRR